MKIFSFGHQKKVGKDTFANYIVTALRTSNKVRRVIKAGFADKLKDVCYQLYSWAGMMPRDFYDQPANEKFKEELIPALGKTPRQIWISFGNEVKNSAYPNTWLDYLLRGVDTDVLVVSDMRFPNEAFRIRQLGGKVVKIIRPSVPHTSDAADDPLLDYTEWDEIIVNDGSLKDLYTKAEDFVKRNFV